MSVVKIYDKLWVIHKFEGTYDYMLNAYTNAKERPISYMCHYEENKSFETRKETGRRWAKNPNKDGTVYDNVPMTGFKIGKSVSRWSTSNKLFRLIDPRGFEVEITTGNLEMLLRDVTVVKGEIQEKCLWARETQNILVSVNSEPYLNSVSMSKDDMKARPKMKDVKIGDVVILSNRQKYVYVGKITIDVEHNVYETDVLNDTASGYTWHSTERQKYKLYDKKISKHSQTFIKTLESKHYFVSLESSRSDIQIFESFANPKPLQNLGPHNKNITPNFAKDRISYYSDRDTLNQTLYKCKENEWWDTDYRIVGWKVS